ncbi:MAG: GNAT family N-acetyltransferase [Candidatus Wallbacteria bacterium]|nr:GNAT family N-acetyltransferase [Candidatus Wallbacteria bacterium]
MKIRTLRKGEERLWVELDTLAGEVEQKLTEFLALREAKKSDQMCFLAAFVGKKLVGKLQGIPCGLERYYVQSLKIAERADFECTSGELISHLQKSLSCKEIMALSETVAPGPMDRLLLERGFQIMIERIFVEREIIDYRSPFDDPFTYKSMDEVGRDLMIQVFTEGMLMGEIREINKVRSKGQPPDFSDEFEQMIEEVGRPMAEKMWRLAFLGEEPVGMVLPSLYRSNPDCGKTEFICIRPAHAGKGYGVILHAYSLEQLSRAGAKKYSDSTDSIKRPMLAVFEKNGCHKVERAYRLYCWLK